MAIEDLNIDHLRNLIDYYRYSGTGKEIADMIRSECQKYLDTITPCNVTCELNNNKLSVFLAFHDNEDAVIFRLKGYG